MTSVKIYFEKLLENSREFVISFHYLILQLENILFETSRSKVCVCVWVCVVCLCSSVATCNDVEVKKIWPCQYKELGIKKEQTILTIFSLSIV